MMQLAKHHCCKMVLLAGTLWMSACSSSQHPLSGMTGATLPHIVAHRGGTSDAPENTLEAIRLSIVHRSDAVWLTVQLSQDGVPVLYRPADLATLTQDSGPVSHRTAAELAMLNAGWRFKNIDGKYPYREHPVGIPTLRDTLRALPTSMPVVLDMKALPVKPQADAIAKVLDDENAWSRVMIYSTENLYQQAFPTYPKARLFESRDETRSRLVKALLGEGCKSAPQQPVWTAFELHRQFTVSEKFTLGEGVSMANATMWTRATVACFRKHAPVKILAIAVNDENDYRVAACLGIDAVLTDSPKKMSLVKEALNTQPLYCPTFGKLDGFQFSAQP